MNKTRNWPTRVIPMLVALALVLSLAGMSLLPVMADPGAELTVSVDTDADTYCCCDNVTVTARITNSGNETATNVTGSISWIPSGVLDEVSGPDPAWGFNITAGSYTDVEWILHCEGPGSVTLKAEAEANNAALAWSQKTILQESAELQVSITSPSKDDVCERSWLVCSSHNVTFSITNIGCQAASLVTATIYPAADIEVVIDGVGRGGGTPWTTPTLGTIQPYQSINYTVEMHCVAVRIGSQIHIKTNGWDVCADEEIDEDYLHSDIIEINQYEPLEITCDAEPNPTKHCHNVTFTATATGGLPDYSWNWTFGDGNSTAGSDWDGTSLDVSHHYSNNTTGPLVFEACVNVTDDCGNTDICCQNITVYPALNASCEADPLQTKVCHNVTFTAEATGGVEPYSWHWDFGDDGTSDEQNPTYHYKEARNFTAIVTVTDFLENVDSCNVTVEVFPRLTANCTATPNPTKVCHNVTFNGTGVGGFPEESCNYTWEWDLGDDTDPVTGDGKTSGNVTHHYAEAGNYTTVFTVWDNCSLNNTATCNVPVEVFPRLSANCTADPNPTKVGDVVTFTGTGVDGLPFPDACNSYNWTWEFGDTSSHTGNGYSGVVSHGYADAGNYTAVFTIQDNCLNNTATCNVTVEVFPSLNVTCDVEPERVHVCHAVNFTAEREGGVDAHNYTWYWDFGDGGNSTAQNSTHTYMCVGNWTATVTLTDTELGNNATCNVTVEVYIEAPDLISPANGAQITTSKNVTFEWQEVACCNYTVVVFQKPPIDFDPVIVVNEDVGHTNTYSHILFNHDWGWYVIAKDACNNTATSATWYFQMDAPEPSVTVQGPNGGETLACNSTWPITWTATPIYATIEIRYSSDGGGTWTQVASGEVNDGAYPWTVPCINSEQCLVRLIARDGCGGEGADTSDGVFSITTSLPPVTCTVLEAGWNLYSTPLIPDNTSIDVVTASINTTVSIIRYYDANTATWYRYIPGAIDNTLTTMEAGKGYWVNMDSTDTLCIEGKELPDPPALPPTYNVVPGWNLIGFKSTIPLPHSMYLLNLWSGGLPNYSVIWGYDSNAGTYIRVYPMGTDNLEPGHGYWLWATAAGIIVPP